MYSKWTNSWLKHWDFTILDILSLQISFLIAYVIRHGFSNPFGLELYRSEALILLICQLLAVYFFKHGRFLRSKKLLLIKKQNFTQTYSLP